MDNDDWDDETYDEEDVAKFKGEEPKPPYNWPVLDSPDATGKFLKDAKLKDAESASGKRPPRFWTPEPGAYAKKEKAPIQDWQVEKEPRSRKPLKETWYTDPHDAKKKKSSPYDDGLYYDEGVHHTSLFWSPPDDYDPPGIVYGGIPLSTVFGLLLILALVLTIAIAID